MTEPTRVSRLAAQGAAWRPRSGPRDRVERLVALLPAVGQTALAAALAWLVATEVLGHQRPFVACVAAIVTLGITTGQSGRRAVEIALGVAVGVLVADLIVLWLGAGPLQIGLVVALAMAAAILLGGRVLVVNQAATSAVLIVTVTSPDALTFVRFYDALVGGGVALVINLVVFPLNPLRLVRRALTPLLDGVADVLDEVGRALRGRDHDAAVDALLHARALDNGLGRLATATGAGGEVARFSPFRRHQLEPVERYARAATHVDLAVRNVRVLARGVLRAVDLEAGVPPETLTALEELAAALRGIGPALEHPDGAAAAGARKAALRAAGRATLGLERTSNLSVTVIVGQVRSTAVDLLRALGMDDETSAQAVRDAAVELARAEAPGAPGAPGAAPAGPAV